MNAPNTSLECSFLALAQASRRLKTYFDRHLSTAGITSTQFNILSELLKQPGIGMLELSELIALDRTSLVRALQPLIRRGYVLQFKKTNHSRKLALQLSAQGSAKCNEAAAFWARAEDLLGFNASDSRFSDFCTALAHLATSRH
jgi:DNA-binding MarR family transcriptional regulator